MSETERYMPFWGEVLLYLLVALLMLTMMIFALTEEILIFLLAFPIAAAFLIGIIWITHKEYKSKLGKRGILGVLLIFFSNFVSEWIWVQLCLFLLGSGVMLYDVASKRNLPVAE